METKDLRKTTNWKLGNEKINPQIYDDFKRGLVLYFKIKLV